MVQGLFGWAIVFGKNRINAESEAEARLLRVFAELGWKSAQVPTNEDYIAKILPEFELLKARADELYKKREKTIFSRKLRREVKTKFYRLISQTLDEQSRQPKARTVQAANTAG